MTEDAAGGGSDADGGNADPCEAGTWDHDHNATTACIAWSTCAVGTYVSQVPSATIDRMCAACASGSFSATENVASCTTWTSCEVGTYVSTAGSFTSDRQCTTCAVGTHSSSANQSTCVVDGSCDAGTEQTAPATATTPPVCAACEVGFYCGGGETTKEACGEGTWDDDSDSATACVARTNCVAGQSVDNDGNATTDRTCEGCASATFSVSTNAETCTPWTSCEPGTHISMAGSFTANQQCAPCADDEYAPSSDLESCLPLDVCAEGSKQITAGTPTTQTVCEVCSSGTYCAGGDTVEKTCADDTWDNDANPATPCVAWKICVAGEYVTSAGSATTNRTCAGCPSSKYSKDENAESCTAWTTCEPGTYASVAGNETTNRQCEPCETGTYSSLENQEECLPLNACPAGTEQTAPGTLSSPPTCATCPTGTFCAGGTNPKETCVGDTWDHDGKSATPCVARTTCIAGWYVASDGSATSDRSCTECPFGKFSTTENAARCELWTSCPEGNYANVAGSTSTDRQCKQCAPGTYTSSPDQTTCQPQGTCALGTEQTAAGTLTSPTVCVACAAGTYCAGGTTPKQTCDNETWDHDAKSTTSCVAWTSCVPGEKVATNGSATTNRTCTSCTDGNYSSSANAPTCTDWSNCAPGSYVSASGSLSTNRQCTGCGNGTYTWSTNQGSCVACTEGSSCSTGNACTTGTRVCGSNGPVCNTTGNASYGTSCSGGYCDGNGSCYVPPAFSYTGWSGQGCSVGCGGGTETYTRQCQRISDSAIVDCSFCGGECSTSGACNTHPCPLYEYEESWGSCSASCGGGTRTFERSCRRISDGGYVDCSFCGGGCYSTNESCNTHPCPAVCPSQTITVPTGGGGFCTGTLPETGQYNPYVTSYTGSPGFTGSSCSYGNVQGGHSGTLFGGPHGTCYSYCDVVASCDGNGNWSNYSFTW